MTGSGGDRPRGFRRHAEPRAAESGAPRNESPERRDDSGPGGRSAGTGSGRRPDEPRQDRREGGSRGGDRASGTAPDRRPGGFRRGADDSRQSERSDTTRQDQRSAGFHRGESPAGSREDRREGGSRTDRRPTGDRPDRTTGSRRDRPAGTSRGDSDGVTGPRRRRDRPEFRGTAESGGDRGQPRHRGAEPGRGAGGGRPDRETGAGRGRRPAGSSDRPGRSGAAGPDAARKGAGNSRDDRRRGPAPQSRGAGRRPDGPGRERPGRGDRATRTPADPARTVALETLRAVRERDAYANLVLPGLLREYRVEGRDAALATELGYGACRALGVLDAVIADCAGRGIDEIDGSLLDILRLGTYQLLRTRIEPHAAVHTAVELARAESGTARSGFVNAVLRRVAERSPREWIERLAPTDPIGRMAFEYAHPTWIAQAFADALGADASELPELLAADDARPLVHLVARPGDITAEELALVTGGEEGRWSPYAVYLEGGDPGALEPVRENMAAVQDEGSQLVALALTRAPLHGTDGGRWLDLCAGPGGKTALLGALADIDGYRIDAVEPARHRAELVRTATRGLPVQVHIADGRDSGLTAGYDRVLVDAPCTGLGALRRRPEARWRRTPGDIADLIALQRELLTAAWDLVRPGGVVVYSTCSPHLPETVAVVADTVRRTGAEQLDARPLLPGVTGLGAGPAAQLWPHRHGTDAMFVAALRKPA